MDNTSKNSTTKSNTKSSARFIYNYIDNLPIELQTIIYNHHRDYFKYMVLTKIRRPLIYGIIDRIYTYKQGLYSNIKKSFRNESDLRAYCKSLCENEKRTLVRHNSYELKLVYEGWAIKSIFICERKYCNPRLGKVVIPCNISYDTKIHGTEVYRYQSDMRYIYQFNIPNLNDPIWLLYDYIQNINYLNLGIIGPYFFSDSEYVEL